MAQGSNIDDVAGEGFDDDRDFDLNFSYNDRIDLNAPAAKRTGLYENGDRVGSCHSSKEPQDADYSCISSLSYELDSQIFARCSISEYWNLRFVNKRCSTLLETGELYKIRKELGLEEPSIFISAIGENTWWSFDRVFKSCNKLPVLPSLDPCFVSGDKESLCAGSHLLVSGKEIDGLVVWRYELSKNKWYKDPSMITPRCLFASATCGSCAYVAGGRGAEPGGQIYDTAEKYNPETRSWYPLPRMRRKRQFCAGCYMDGKFYVIGGRNDEGGLTCGEYYDETRNVWQHIPDMLKDDPVKSSHSPPLLAVVNNELYSLETSTNQLKVYLKKTNTWRSLGPVPVRANCHRGWGVAFKSLGNELLVIGAASCSCDNHMAIYTCCPDFESGEVKWRYIESSGSCLRNFILTCCVMLA